MLLDHKLIHRVIFQIRRTQILLKFNSISKIHSHKYEIICDPVACISFTFVTLYIYTAFLGTFAKFRRRLFDSLSICPSAWNSNPNGWIFMEYGMSIFRKSVKNTHAGYLRLQTYYQNT